MQPFTVHCHIHHELQHPQHEVSEGIKPGQEQVDQFLVPAAAPHDCQQTQVGTKGVGNQHFADIQFAQRLSFRHHAVVLL